MKDSTNGSVIGLFRPATVAVVAGICASVLVVSSSAAIGGDRGRALGRRHAPGGGGIGEEKSVPRHLSDGHEYSIPIGSLVAHGQRLFTANWTSREGGGRPLTKGTGKPLSDPTDPLIFPRNFNRISSPDANSCAGCHNAPFGIAGGGGDFVTSVFVLGQRFDHITFDHADAVPTKGAADESGHFVTLPEAANSRATLGMFGSGYIEMLARQMTEQLQMIRDSLADGQNAPLLASGVSFGVLARGADGSWDVSGVEGLAAPSLKSTGLGDPPSLIIRPFHQAGAVVSIREFTNNAMNHHHGIQSTERFGSGTDPDEDGFVDELTRADMTAVSVFQATLGVPGRVIPRRHSVERAIRLGERMFEEIGCASCHVPALPLTEKGWVFTEPNPFNPVGNLRPGEAAALRVDLNDGRLPGPRLTSRNGVTYVPAYTDLKLHDITGGPADPNVESLDQQQPAGSDAFFAGNARFLTRKLWGVANEQPFFHHGKFTTLREAVMAHAGEAELSRQAFEGLSEREGDAVIEFLKSLRVLPPGTKHRIVDERYVPRPWSGLQ